MWRDQKISFLQHYPPYSTCKQYLFFNKNIHLCFLSDCCMPTGSFFKTKINACHSFLPSLVREIKRWRSLTHVCDMGARWRNSTSNYRYLMRTYVWVAYNAVYFVHIVVDSFWCFVICGRQLIVIRHLDRLSAR